MILKLLNYYTNHSNKTINLNLFYECNKYRKKESFEVYIYIKMLNSLFNYIRLTILSN